MGGSQSVTTVSPFSTVLSGVLENALRVGNNVNLQGKYEKIQCILQNVHWFSF